MTWNKMTVEYASNACKIKCKLPEEVENYKSCDLFIGENEVLFSSGCILFRLKNLRKLDTKAVQKVQIDYNPAEKEFSFQLQCIPDESLQENTIKLVSMNSTDPIESQLSSGDVDMNTLKRVTDFCSLCVGEVPSDFDQKFSYGFGLSFQDDTSLAENTLKFVCKIPDPSHNSLLMRRYQREVEEAESFCKDQYKLNFIELDIPEGLANPMEYVFNFKDDKLTTKQEDTLKNICEKKESTRVVDDQVVDCGLVDILLAICYDVRSTQNELTCESAWTRNMLSPSLSYFEPTYNLRDVIQIFLRRSLIYPLYRNYDFGQTCIRDAIEALKKGPKWILKQFLETYDIFLTSEDSRQLLNKYFIEDYIRYLNSAVEENHLMTLSRNLKNSSLNANKKDLRLGINEIEGEILYELINDMHLGHSSDSDDVSSEEEEEENDENADDDEEENSEEEEEPKDSTVTKSEERIISYKESSL